MSHFRPVGQVTFIRDFHKNIYILQHLELRFNYIRQINPGNYYIIFIKNEISYIIWICLNHQGVATLAKEFYLLTAGTVIQCPSQTCTSQGDYIGVESTLGGRNRETELILSLVASLCQLGKLP
jgi:hypothetical protein